MFGSRSPTRFRRRENGDPDVARVGVPRDGWRDAYHFILVQPWSVFYLLLIGVYLLVNCAFASLYWLHPGCIGETPAGAWTQDFFFSLETIATVGYGVLHPVSLYAHLVAGAEILVGVLMVPLLTGVTIVKFARPHARVEFSRNMVLTEYDGVPTLMFRVANIRRNQIYQTAMNMTLLRLDTSAEGHRLRRLVELKLVRDNNPMFVLTWTVMHRIDAASPLHGVDLAGLEDGTLELLAVMTGLDSTTSATVHARHVYASSDILPDHVFDDIVLVNDAGRYTIDYRRLHLVRLASPAVDGAA